MKFSSEIGQFMAFERFYETIHDTLCHEKKTTFVEQTDGFEYCELHVMANSDQ